LTHEAIPVSQIPTCSKFQLASEFHQPLYDEDEEEMMYMMEEDGAGAGGTGKQSGAGAGGGGGDATQGDSTQPGGADEDDLDWLMHAGGTQTQGIPAGGAAAAGGGAGDNSGDEEDDVDTDAAIFAAPKPTPLLSNARADAPKLDATAVGLGVGGALFTLRYCWALFTFHFSLFTFHFTLLLCVRQNTSS
jgi:hypothetical protein